MNTSDFYEIGIVVNSVCILINIFFLCVFYNELKSKKSLFISASIAILLCIIGIYYCNEKRIATYKEVYYLEYTVYYPGNTCKFKVDSCNHVYASSDRGTNHIRYYSIPKKDTYGTDTTAPIVINKIIKK